VLALLQESAGDSALDGKLASRPDGQMASVWWSAFDVCLGFFCGQQPYCSNRELLNRRTLSGRKINSHFISFMGIVLFITY